MPLWPRTSMLLALAIAGGVVAALAVTAPGDAGAGRLGEWRAAPVRAACAEVNAGDDPLLPAFPPRPHRISEADYSRAIQLTATLHCYLATREAVCAPDNRAVIVDHLGKYYGKMDGMLDLARLYGRDEVRRVAALWDSPRNREIAVAVEDHVRAGRLRRSDFAWSLPERLAPLLDTNATAPDTCPAQRIAGR